MYYMTKNKVNLKIQTSLIAPSSKNDFAVQKWNMNRIVDELFLRLLHRDNIFILAGLTSRHLIWQWKDFKMNKSI